MIFYARKIFRKLAGNFSFVVQDWHKDTQSRRIVRSAVEAVLHDKLPTTYDHPLFSQNAITFFR